MLGGYLTGIREKRPWDDIEQQRCVAEAKILGSRSKSDSILILPSGWPDPQPRQRCMQELEIGLVSVESSSSIQKKHTDIEVRRSSRPERTTRADPSHAITREEIPQTAAIAWVSVSQLVLKADQVRLTRPSAAMLVIASWRTAKGIPIQIVLGYS